MLNQSTAVAQSADLGFTPRHLIDGELVASDKFFPVVDPSTAQVFAECPEAGRDQLDRAVAAAGSAQKEWAKVPVPERRDAVARYAARLIEHKEAIARLIVMEQGKPLPAALGEVQRAADSMNEICTIDIEKQIIRNDQRGRAELHLRPLGVIGAITPWNVPIALGAPKIASAIYTGNAVVMKPSSFTPLSSLMLASVTADILPPGVCSILAGGSGMGQWICEHPDIAKINFTGSIPTGKRVMATAAAGLKRVTLELGGNDAALVLEDADIETIAPRLFSAAFGLAGQVCMAIKRLYVHESLYARVVEAISELARSAKIGNGFEEGVEVGPVQNRKQFEDVLEFIEDTKRVAGARITVGGHAIDRPGYFIAPTVVADISEGTRLVDEEPFGPILPIIPFSTVEEAVDRANASCFGLGGSVWTRDVERGAEIAARLEAGFTWVNHHVGTTRDLPFGGVKESGIGRNGGELGVRSDMEAQIVMVPHA